MRRRLFTLTSAISLALCLASLVLWAWSYDAGDYFWYGTQARESGLISSRGYLLFYHEAVVGTFRFPSSSSGFGTAHLKPHDVDDFSPARSWFSLPGLRLMEGSDLRTDARCVAIGAWILVLATLVLPIGWARARLLSAGLRERTAPAPGTPGEGWGGGF